MSARIRQALILAHHGDQHEPLALVRTGGLPNLVRALLTLKRDGVRRFLVHGGAHLETLQQAVLNDSRVNDLDVQWIHLDEARSETEAVHHATITFPANFFYVVPTDRVFSAQILTELREQHVEGLTLAVETSGSEPSCNGLEVQMGDEARIQSIGHGRRDGTWTGLALCNGKFSVALDRVCKNGCADRFATTVDRIASQGIVRIADVKGQFWQHIHDQAGQKLARKKMLHSLRKPHVDGVISTHINRHFSLFITRLLMNTAVKPNHITILTMIVALVGGIIAAMATPDSAWLLGVGAVLWQVASMLDGTDGELARLKFQYSKYGEWLDTIVDDAGRLVIFLGVGYGLSQVMASPFWLAVMLATIGLQLLLTIRIYTLLYQIGEGSHFALAWTSDHERTGKTSTIGKVWKRIEFMARRDYYVFVFMSLIVVGLPTFAVGLNALTTAIIFTFEVLHPRQPRDRRITALVAIRDEPRR